MTEKQPMLCVGGPKDGAMLAILHGTRMRMPVYGPMAEYDPRKPTEFCDYRIETYRTPDGDISVWVPEGQTPLQTMRMLLDSYSAVRDDGLAAAAPDMLEYIRSSASAGCATAKQLLERHRL